MNRTTVVKFGGTSVSSRENWEHIVSTINKQKADSKIVIVISALTGVTDKLVSISSQDTSFEEKEDLVRQIYDQHLRLATDCGIELSELVRTGCDDVVGLYTNNSDYFEPVIKANIVAYGEILSTRLGVDILNKLHVKCSLKDTRDIVKVPYDETRHLYSNFLDANINYMGLPDYTFDEDIVLLPGFICSKMYNGQYRSCLMGRGGSDTCGSLIAYMTNAKLYEIYTDVNGVYDSDPNKNKDARFCFRLTYDEAYDLAINGAKVLHCKCIAPLKAKEILCVVKNINEATLYTTISKYV
jgi:diaminopimelate decarboxylase/aspartate kinase